MAKPDECLGDLDVAVPAIDLYVAALVFRDKLVL
jgi:hypothetical protein